jgi:hypothetical protein
MNVNQARRVLFYFFIGCASAIYGQGYTVNHSTISSGGAFKKINASKINSTLGESLISKPVNNLKLVSAGFQALHPITIVTSIRTTNEEYTVRIFPNPFYNYLYITSEKKFTTLRLTDIKGNTVFQTDQISYPITNLDFISPGIYILSGKEGIKEFILGKLIKI